MVITPLIAAIIVGSFWTGVGTTALLSQESMLESDSDVVITAEASLDDEHVAACEAKYRSYVEETDMYLSFGGEWKPCLL